MLKKQLLTFLCLAAADLGGLLIALVAGLFLRQAILPLFTDLFATEAPWRLEYFWLFAISIGVFAYEGLYARRRTAWEELRHLLRGATVAFVLFLAVMTLLKAGADISRPAVFLAWVLAPWFLVAIRLKFKILLFKTAFWPRSVLFAGCGPEAIQLAAQMQKFQELGYVLSGFLCGEGQDPNGTGANLGGLDALEAVLEGQSVDEVIIALPAESRLTQFDLLRRAEALVPKVSVLPELFDADKLNVEVEKVERYFLLSFQNNLMKRSNRHLKSAAEIVVLFVSLPVWAPLLLVLAVAVKFSSPGPVLFRQARIGRDGSSFGCLKFRTMVADAEERLAEYLQKHPEVRAEWEAERKLKNDPRVTPVGHFLRRTSLDELPQVLNVLGGQMSLVGPRPIVADEIEKYGEYFQYYRAVCPGLSGLWQVSGRNDVDYQQRVMLDTFYVRNWSLWLDFMILLRTLPAVLKREGAY
ncbi:undecaprenyl-phosphate galactose phosphotransferase WbaP [uncultured Desulfuromonas sp.]|uniref:undecaprenyl-phosphate galactose phosphotransferase WbaP n=1 Tax=uncultured Desulfuromonas sp. TaxID=181013 RepID=UPI002633F71A|nr:undecaprenyl-phosphate galactose phosphotransferase WbaP [uncultured Desulfuromonas sp.]